jgi:hypothetical protein
MRNRHPLITVSYDDAADVLYVRVLEARDTKNIENIAGLVLRSDPITHAPVGATIIDYKEHWLPKKFFLVERLAEFFEIPKQDAERALESVIDER